MSQLSQIDPNFAVESCDGREPVWLEVTEPPFSLHGLMRTDDGARFCRMPQAVAEDPGINEGVRALYTNTAGGRVRFSTDSPFLALKCRFNARSRLPHMPPLGVRGFDLLLNGEHDSVYIRSFLPDMDSRDGYSCAPKNLPLGGMNFYTLNFPLYNNVDRLWLGFAPGSRVEAGKPYRYPKPAVFYGSSITQGGCASRPGNSYPALLSSWLDMDYINLGFSGSGKGEVPMMEYIASLDMGMLVYDFDHNAANAGELSLAHEQGFRIVREKHPALPVIFVTRPDWRADIGKEITLRRKVIYDTYHNAIHAGDKNVAIVDGRSLFAGKDRHDCTVDGTHPNDIGMFAMAEGICDAMELFLRPIR